MASVLLDVDSKFPSGKITKQYGRCMGEPVEYGVSSPRLQIAVLDKKNQLDVTFCILYFSSNSCSTCFGQPCAHHQELTTA